MCIIVVLLIVAFVDGAKIAINLKVEPNNQIVQFFSGIDVQTVTDSEIKAFNITPQGLKHGTRVLLGKTPYDVYLKNPTPYGDLYKKFKWQEVKRNLKVKNIDIINIANEDYVIDTHVYINNSTINATAERKLYKEIENTVETIWMAKGLPQSETFYNMTFDFGYGNFNIVDKWRNSSLYSKNMIIGKSLLGNIIIKPGQSVVTKLSATKVTIVLELVYEAYLTGSAIAAYDVLYGKHHFWAPDVENVLKAENITNVLLTKEHIIVKCIFDPILKVFDKKTGVDVEPDKMKHALVKIFRNKQMNMTLHFNQKKQKKESDANDSKKQN